MMKLFYFVMMLFFSVFCRAQNTPLFKTGDRVCFIGNSITHSGEYHHNILLYHTTRFPDVKFKIFNCGVAGDRATDISNRMDSDILVRQPNIAIVSIGMNDVYYQSDLVAYQVNLEAVITKLLSKGITVMLQKPSLYDETTVNSTSFVTGKNLALKGAGDVMQNLAVKHNLKIVDYWQIMNDVNNAIHLTAPTTSIIRTDRIHPISTGHLVMAYQFVKTNSASNQQLVSKTVIDTDVATSQNQSANCSISNLSIQGGKVTFTSLENSLPFPTFAEQLPVLDYIPFTTDINTELLQVKNLPTGDYAVRVDSVVVGNFTNLALQNGVNLSTITNAPQYQQAEKVRLNLNKLWVLEANLRAISYITYDYLKDFVGDKNDVVAVKSFLDNKYGTVYATTYAYMKTQLDLYVKYKNAEKNLYVSSDSLRDEIYKLAMPVSHTFKVYPATPPNPNNLIKDSSFDLNFIDTYNALSTDLGWSSCANFNAGEFVSTKKSDLDGNHYYSCTTSIAKDDYNHALAQYTSKAIAPGKYKLTFGAKADAGSFYLKLSTKTATSVFLASNLTDASTGITLSANKIYIAPTADWQSYSCVFDMNFPATDYVRVFFQFHNKGTYEIREVQLFPYVSTAVNEVQNEIQLFSRNGSICLSGSNRVGTLEVYSVTGMLLKRIDVRNGGEFPFAKGNYIVKWMDGKSILKITKIII